MSIELMERALDFIYGVYFGEHNASNADRDKLEADLAAAIQQAKAQQSTTPEPVAWIRRHPNGALSNELLIHVQVEQVHRDSGAWVPLYTHPAQSVPGDVVRDAERWCAVERASCDVTLRLHNTRSGLRSAVIDAAIAAKDASA